MLEVTERQAEILAFITARFSETGTGVGFDAICEKFGMQKNAVTGHVNALCLKGVLMDEKLPNGRRMANSLRPKGDVMPFDAKLRDMWNDTRIEENYTINLISGNRVAFMIFSETGMVDAGVYPVEQAVKMAEQMKAPADMAVIDKLVVVAEFMVRRKLQTA